MAAPPPDLPRARRGCPAAGAGYLRLTPTTTWPTRDGGTHPNPKRACDALRRVHGKFEALPSVPGMGCPDVYDPVTARATGHWQSSPLGPSHKVDYAEKFSNRCQAAIGTGFVFAF